MASAAHNVHAVYTAVEASLGGMGGGGAGESIYGELTQGSMQAVLDAMHAAAAFTQDSVFLDVGSGVGKPNFHAAAMPSVRIAASIGVEHAKTRYLLSMAALRAVLRRDTALDDRANVTFVHGDVLDMRTFAPATHVYSFNTGMPHDAQEQLVRAFVASGTSRVLCCYTKPRDVADAANSLRQVASVQVRMTGGEGKTAYVYIQDAAAGAVSAEPDATLRAAADLCAARSPAALFARAVRAQCTVDAPPVSPATLAHFRAMGVDDNPSMWCPLCVQAVCWGVPLWVLRAAGPLRVDGLPKASDPMHWVLRLWPALHGAGEPPAQTLTHTAVSPGLALQHFWASDRSAQAAAAAVPEGGAAAPFLPTERAAYLNALTAVPMGLRCPDVPAPWTARATLSARRKAWGWLRAVVDRAPPNAVVSTSVRGSEAFRLDGVAEVAVLAAAWHPDASPGQRYVALDEDSSVATNESVRTLRTGGWLVDDAMDVCMRLLQRAAAPAVCAVPVRVSAVLHHAYDYGFLAEITSAAALRAVRAARLVLCPLHIMGSHWALCVLDRTARVGVYYDSKRGTSTAVPPVVQRVTRFVDDADEVRGASAWTVSAARHAPAQRNTSDCGMFVLQYAAAVVAAGELEPPLDLVDQAHMPYVRARTMLACFAAGLTGSRPGLWRRYMWTTDPVAWQHAATPAGEGGAEAP